jgi:hypothetical protein
VHLGSFSGVQAGADEDASATVLQSGEDLARGLDGSSPGDPEAGSRLSSFYDLDGRAGSPAEEAVVLPPEAEPTLTALADARDALSVDELPAGAPVPTPLRAAAAKARRAMLGTSFLKIGMEVVVLSGQLIAMRYFGSAAWVAAMAIVWAGSMAAGSGLSGGLLDRKPANKVVAFAMAAQALSVAAMAAVVLGGAVTPAVILPLHALGGLLFGVVMAGRECLPARLFERKQRPLEEFNSKNHIAFQAMGTLAPLLFGFVLQRFGLAAALCLHPPAFLLGALVFYGLDIPAAEAAGKTAAWSMKSSLQQFLSDLRSGAGVVFGRKDLRLVMLVNSGAMAMNRVIKTLVMPLFAKTVLAEAAKTAWLASASNFGQLIGAAILLRTLAGGGRSEPAPHRWIPWLALGTFSLWTFSLGADLHAALLMLSFLGLAWAGNFIGMNSYLQSTLPDASAGKAMGFMKTVETSVVMAALYLLGALFDAIPAAWAFPAFGILATVVAAAYMFAWLRLSQSSQRVKK